MGTILTSLDELTPAWLSAVLKNAGTPGAERLVAVRQHSIPAFNSQVVHLEIEYSQSSNHQASPLTSHSMPSAIGSQPWIIKTYPASLLLKLNHNSDGETEALFYEQAKSMDLPMLVDCFAVQFDKETGNSYLILEDVSETHQSPVTRQALLTGQGVPEQSALIGIAGALAHFHAAWWQRQIIGPAAALTKVRPWYASTSHHNQHVLRRQTELETFLSNAGSYFSSETRRLLENALERLPGLWINYIQPRVEAYHQLTLTHGDCYLTQFLVPKQPGSAATHLVDFDSASGNFPAYDLVYLLSTFWNRDQRLEDAREQHFLVHYHTVLCQAGVDNYSFADLCQDYRLILAYMLFDAVADQVRGSSPAYWQPKLHCLVEAYQDWDCASL